MVYLLRSWKIVFSNSRKDIECELPRIFTLVYVNQNLSYKGIPSVDSQFPEMKSVIKLVSLFLFIILLGDSKYDVSSVTIKFIYFE